MNGDKNLTALPQPKVSRRTILKSTGSALVGPLLPGGLTQTALKAAISIEQLSQPAELLGSHFIDFHSDHIKFLKQTLSEPLTALRHIKPSITGQSAVNAVYDNITNDLLYSILPLMQAMCVDDFEAGRKGVETILNEERHLEIDKDEIMRSLKDPQTTRRHIIDLIRNARIALNTLAQHPDFDPDDTYWVHSNDGYVSIDFHDVQLVPRIDDIRSLSFEDMTYLIENQFVRDYFTTSNLFSFGAERTQTLHNFTNHPLFKYRRYWGHESYGVIKSKGELADKTMEYFGSKFAKKNTLSSPREFELIKRISERITQPGSLPFISNPEIKKPISFLEEEFNPDSFFEELYSEARSDTERRYRENAQQTKVSTIGDEMHCGLSFRFGEKHNFYNWTRALKSIFSKAVLMDERGSTVLIGMNNITAQDAHIFNRWSVNPDTIIEDVISTLPTYQK